MRASLLIALTILLSLSLQAKLSAQSTARPSGGGVTLRGRVVEARTGEPVAKVKVIVSGASQSTTTDESGEFSLPNQQPGEVELYITSVNYGLVKKTILVREGAAESINIKIALGEEAATLTEEVTVTSGPFERTTTNAPSEQTLNKSELQKVSSVIVSDPVRAAQALPGAMANDDFRSEFAVRGLGFDHVGVYLDGVLTDNFVHTVQGNFPDTGSLSVINADTLSSVSLLSGAYPSEFGDSTAAVLNLDTRDGNRLKLAGRVSVSMSSTSGVFDGPFAGGRGSWLLAARKSYLGYLVRRINDANDNTNDSTFDFADVHGKALYDLSPRHQVGFSLITGNFQFERRRPREELGVNSVRHTEANNLLVNAHWNYVPGQRFLIQTRVFGLRTSYSDVNPDDLQLEEGRRTQVGVRSDINFLARPSHRVEAGVYLRSTRADQVSRRFTFFQPTTALGVVAFDRGAAEQSGYLQDTWSSERLHLSLTGGGRVEHSRLTGETVFSPRASFGWGLGTDWRIRAGFGRYYQFPQLEHMFGRLGNSGLRAERATHYNLSVERVFGERTRVLAEVYDREDANFIFSLSEPRVEAGRLNFSELPFRNALGGHARGVELTLHRRSANGLTGWVTYAYSKTMLRDERTGLEFVSDFDQRHTLNAYGGYRLNETVSFSGVWRYGSGMPVPGFFELRGPTLFLSGERNRFRLPDYQRLDLRASKAFLFDKWKLTLTGEVINVLNHENLRYAGFDEFRTSGAVIGSFDKLLPILPSVGVVIEF